MVFVTAHDQYAIRAFEINAIDYLLKPVTGNASNGRWTEPRRDCVTANRVRRAAKSSRCSKPSRPRKVI